MTIGGNCSTELTDAKRSWPATAAKASSTADDGAGSTTSNRSTTSTTSVGSISSASSPACSTLTPTGVSDSPNGWSVHAVARATNVHGAPGTGPATTSARPGRAVTSASTGPATSAAWADATITTAGSHASPPLCRARRAKVLRDRVSDRAPISSVPSSIASSSVSTTDGVAVPQQA